jgi:hypothetical protein
MDPGRWRQINAIFLDVLERPTTSRQRCLVDLCGGDPELFEAVQRLVEAHERASGFLAQPAAAAARSLLLLEHGSAPSSSGLESGSNETEFHGTERYTLLRRIGAGGMGIVYAAHDGVRDGVVALKTLLCAGPADVSRLKREFRSLSDIAHLNLVCLHELVVEPAICFFTMELVDGLRVSEYVRAGAGSRDRDGHRADPYLVRNVFRQLVAGVSALHGKGKLHRDIKPSNVLVKRDGRLVILDFGLASDAAPGSALADDGMAGTPAYLAPEQLSGAGPSEATDWYAVGVTLYETLTGRLPFRGSWHELREQKHRSDPAPPESVDPTLPGDLSQICMGLLRRDPVRRLSGSDALERLCDTHTRHREVRPAPARRLKPFFVGRTYELGVLSASLETVRAGHAAAVCAHGPSGIGKTALVQRFLDQLAPDDETVILRGRCYQHESVPYQALDAVIESLTQYLHASPPARATALLPPGTGALARVFPVLLQVEPVARAAAGEPDDLEPSAQRHLAFSALRELLARIAQRHTLVVYIDDLHWADADSMRSLEALLRPPHPPPLLLLACLRTEEVATKPFLQAFLEGATTPRRTALRLEPLTDNETRAIMTAWLPAEARLTAADRLALAREAGGNPFLLEQLAQYAAARDGGSAPGTALADMLHHRLQEWPHGARRFLDVLAVCGRPMAPQVVYEAAGHTGDERPLVAILRSDHFLRHSGSASHIEMYHDRLRETLIAQLSPDETRAIHGRLMRTLMARGADEPEGLFEHCLGAGDSMAAARQAARAAAKAHTVLAFDRAASFYRSALELVPNDPAAPAWRQGLGEALTQAGRPPEAARIYLEAATDARGWPRIELLRRAAEQYLVGGHIDEGLNVIRTVLHALDMGLAPSPMRALVSLVWGRTRIRCRGLAFRTRAANHIPPDRLLRIDTCWSIATGLALVDYVRAADFNTRHLLQALEAGEPYRMARALALEAGFMSSSGSRRVARRFAKRAASLARESGHRHAEALSALTAGMAALMNGEWKEAARLCGDARVILREHCPGATWETNCAEIFLLGAQLFQGDIHEASLRLPALLTDAADRGHRFFEIELRTRMNLVWLAADRPDEGHRHATEVMEGWSQDGYYGQHYSQALARIQTELYRGDAEAAWRLAADAWPALTRTLLLNIRFVRIEASYLRARAALLNAARGRDVTRFLAVARGDARRIGRFGQRWSEAIALVLGAGISCLEGRPARSRDLLAKAVSAFERADMGAHAAAAQRRLGERQGGERGRRLVADADAWMSAHGIRNPPRMTRMFAPGFPDADDA